MAQYATAIKDGEFPVTWTNNFANYGLPLPIFAHQLSAYLGALLILLGFSVVAAYNCLMFLAVFLSALSFYCFLRKYANSNQSLFLTLLMSLFPYRIHNIYIRGALPEMIASIFYPLILLGIYQFNVEKKKFALVPLLFSIFFLAISHPMMLFIFLLPAVIYFFLTLDKKNIKIKLFFTSSAVVLALLMATFYLLPLVTEIKYFYQGREQVLINQEEFLNFNNFFTHQWPYFYAHPGPRGNFLQFGLIELVIVILGVVVICVELIKRKFKNFHDYLVKNKLMIGLLLVIILAIFLMSKISQVIYSTVPGFANLQYPWRFLVWVQLFIPLLFFFILQKLKLLNNSYLQIFFICMLLFIRVPQLYGKNYTQIPEDKFYFNQANLHSQNFNTVWSANSLSYPVREIQAELIEGDAQLSIIEVKNASRRYHLIANGPVRLIDYTFYFPGWQVLANGEKVAIEFQDSDYRGLITYRLEKGEYDLELFYQASTIRRISQALALLAYPLFFLWLYYLAKKDIFKNLKKD